MLFKPNILTLMALVLMLTPAQASTLSDQPANNESASKNAPQSLADLCESDIDEAVLVGNPEFDKNLVERLNQKGLVSAIEPTLKRFVLYKGKMLLACSKRIHLLLANADLDLAPNSLVYICDNGIGTCAIVNLHDEHLDAVKIQVGEAKVSLPPGHQLILTSYMDAGFDEVNLCNGVRFRDLAEFKPVPTIKAFSTQYSIVSAIQALPAVRKLARSNTKEGHKMLKTAAAVYTATGYPTDFR